MSNGEAHTKGANVMGAISRGEGTLGRSRDMVLPGVLSVRSSFSFCKGLNPLPHVGELSVLMLSPGPSNGTYPLDKPRTSTPEQTIWTVVVQRSRCAFRNHVIMSWRLPHLVERSSAYAPKLTWTTM